MPRRLTLEINDHYRERLEIPDTFVLQLLRQATRTMGDSDALELLAWASEQALANEWQFLSDEIGEIAIPIRTRPNPGLAGTALGRYLAIASGKKDAPARGSEATE